MRGETLWEIFFRVESYEGVFSLGGLLHGNIPVGFFCRGKLLGDPLTGKYTEEVFYRTEKKYFGETKRLLQSFN